MTLQKRQSFEVRLARTQAELHAVQRTAAIDVLSRMGAGGSVVDHGQQA